MIHHYITQYIDENGKHVVESWLQINMFGRCYCFSRRKIIVHLIKAAREAEV